MGYILDSNGDYLLDSNGIPLTDSNPFPSALTIITQALRKMGVYAPSETITDSDAQQGLESLNDMLDGWSNDSLSCFAVLEQSFNLLPGVSSYTIGPGGDVDKVRPLKIMFGTGTAYLLDMNNDKYPVEVITRDKFNLVSQPNVNSDLPSFIFYDPQFPLGIINVYPAPNIGYPLFFDSYQQLGAFTSLSTLLSLPPGYKKALQDNLVIDLWPFFKADAAQIPGNLERDAARSLMKVKRTNIRPSSSVYDPEIIAKARGSFNIFTNNYSR
jgi:hypothetical protein